MKAGFALIFVLLCLKNSGLTSTVTRGFFFFKLLLVHASVLLMLHSTVQRFCKIFEYSSRFSE